MGHSCVGECVLVCHSLPAHCITESQQFVPRMLCRTLPADIIDHLSSSPLMSVRSAELLPISMPTWPPEVRRGLRRGRPHKRPPQPQLLHRQQQLHHPLQPQPPKVAARRCPLHSPRQDAAAMSPQTPLGLKAHGTANSSTARRARGIALRRASGRRRPPRRVRRTWRQARTA